MDYTPILGAIQYNQHVHSSYIGLVVALPISGKRGFTRYSRGLRLLAFLFQLSHTLDNNADCIRRKSFGNNLSKHYGLVRRILQGL
jgi:hypothetical protein